MMLHASVRINAHLLCDQGQGSPRSLCGFLFKSIIHQNYTHTCAHKQICLLNNDLQVYLHIVMRVSKATQGEYLMNNGGKSG